MVKVSIIIPCYNSEKFIRDAFNTIPYREDIEVIMINDGSTDRTKEIIEEIIEKNQPYFRNNLKLINHEENMGIGWSRRHGLEKATGEYIMFFDSDDTINIENFLQALEMLDGSDIIYYDLIQNDGVVLHLTPETKGIYPGAVKFIKKSYIDNFEYPTMKEYEDVYFNGELHSVPHTDRYTNLIVVNYNFPREDSTSAKWRRGEKV